MTEEPYPIKVIYRKFPEGDIIALFPEEPGTNNPYTCDSYQHIGQHGAADPGIIYETDPALPEEYASLQAELISIGYVPIVCKRYTRRMFEKRVEALNLYTV